MITLRGRKIGEAEESVAQPPEVAIQHGDSGGGVFIKNKNGTLQLAGVLSTKTVGEPLGHYSANKSLDFVRCVMGKETPSETDRKPDSRAPKSMSEISK